MRDQYEKLSRGKANITKMRIQGKESVMFEFGNNTVLDTEVMEAIRKHGAWHLYCSDFWNSGDFSVFKPVADIVKKITVSAEKSTIIKGLNCLEGLETVNVDGDVSEVDFTQLKKLRSLTISQNCRGGNWQLCESLDYLLVDVSLPNLKKLKALKNLRSLSCCKGVKSFEGIADLPALRELRVGACHLASLESLGQLPKLQLLLLNLMPKLINLKGIEGLPNLEDLHVSQCGGLRDVTAISTLKKLKKLLIEYCPHIGSLEGVQLAPDCQVEFQPKGKVGDGF